VLKPFARKTFAIERLDLIGDNQANEDEHSTATTRYSHKLSILLKRSRARINDPGTAFLLRALPAWKRNGSVDAAPAAKLPSATPKASDEMRILVEHKALEAEARCCGTLRVNGTGSRAVPWFEDAHHFRKCASWKIPMIPSKMRTLLQDAHVKQSIFAERCGARPPGPRVPHCGCCRLSTKIRRIHPGGRA
jgi:hypothetical protein